MVKLSIIIPHYNSLSTLKKLISTIPKTKEIEIIVIDDNSNEQIKEFKELQRNEEYKRVTFLNNNINKKGAGASRNIGLNYAQGEWLLFADADDFFLKDFYTIITKYLTSNYDVVFFTPTSIEIDSGNQSNRHKPYKKLINNYLDNEDSKSETRLRYEFFVPWTKLIKRKFIESNNICFDEVQASNDVMFSAKVGHYMNNFFVTEENIYCVTRGAGTLTTKTNIELYDARLSVYINYCNFIKKRLEKSSLRYLRIHGLGILLRAYRNKLGIKKIIQVYYELKKNKIRLLDYRFLNPVFIIIKTKAYYKRYKIEKRYYTK